jgi:hypothetical protein
VGHTGRRLLNIVRSALRAGARVARLIGRESDDLGYNGIAQSVLEYIQESRRSSSYSGEKLN